MAEWRIAAADGSAAHDLGASTTANEEIAVGDRSFAGFGFGRHCRIGHAKFEGPIESAGGFCSTFGYSAKDRCVDPGGASQGASQD